MDPKRPEVRGTASASSGRAPRSRPATKPRKVQRAKGSRRAQASAAASRFVRRSSQARAQAAAEGRPHTGVWLGSLRVSGLTILIGALTVLGIGVLAPQINILVQQRHEVADLQEQVRTQTEALNSLEKQRARWEDPAYIRAQARERLFYVMPGDISFIVINDVPIEQRPAAKPTATLKQTQTDWVAGLMNSVLVAGLSTATPDQIDAAKQKSGSQ